MENLKWLREQGELMNQVDRAQLPTMTIAESTRIFAMLYKTMRPMLEATEYIYRAKRARDQRELQRRLARFARWEKRRERTLLQRRKIAKRGRDIDDVQNIIARQNKNLNDKYILDWLRQFEQALDDSTLISEYKRLREIK